MKLFARARLSAAALATVTLVTVSAGFVETAPAYARAPSKPQPAILNASAVAVSDKYAADAAEQIFNEGGNAVDAAVAIAFSLAVTYPEAGNIGGGGFMTLYVDGKPYFMDYRERAPLAATKNMYLDDQGNVIKGKSLFGYYAVGVPGTVAGMSEVQHRFGKLTWKQVLAPAIKYARDGFVVDEALASRREEAAKDFAGKTNFDTYFGAMKAGTTFKQPDLAAVLTRIANQGAKDFYQGKTADLIAASMRGHGLITKQDLQQYKAVWRQPVLGTWNGYDVITAPPPSSGGIGLLQLLQMKADLAPDFKDVALNSPQYVHLIAEIEKRVFADRAQYLGDPDFYKVPVAQLTDPAYIAKRAAEVNPNQPSDTKSVQPGLGTSMPEKAETTHFSVVDKWGNAVSNTYTLNGWFGSGVVAEGTGIVLNDEMDDFSAKPGVANMFGVVGSDANSIEPKKRPLSSMTPTIMTKDGKVSLVIGTPGGSRIFTSIFQVINNVYDFNMPLKEAVAAMRFHHQLLPPNTIFWEPYKPIDGELAQQIEAKGYNLKGQDFSGDIQAIKINGDTPDAAADPRGRGVTRLIP
ncbi:MULTISPECIES: gamma-glutamyltransferase [Paraburkholderia]|uniref:Glutathione hydrolase proenzyme n=1 Tax=Paraburkholderia megapolitana TaxID=420953 RepID=A0A1I3PPA5_9BURK|nr:MULTISPECIES: gamma-glutamyltransferase [Paraburkholderia]MCX4162851.1 gamma-glutamyltransferase [Paraburkholderia megapolitana]MDN7158346.1 gamma-glutamyltransferase [Paraburkholderia sp. CHISQ3]MDQ6495393.1 gamma-glutamyltransferase [Paraburkholderia megapolitana]QDQ80942.1 gamma-glutamyltransferase [Paraburkholderia megapolitana]SFJ23398.1 gamma-glutamyltransferase 1 Threonine peptidase. MEROPS family T03 [Paraburkholderia megapolitana]